MYSRDTYAEGQTLTNVCARVLIPVTGEEDEMND